MTATLAAARAGATTGEWAGTLREVFGEFRAPTGVSGAVGAADAGSELTAVRESVRATGEELGGRLRLLVGKPGLDGHSNGAEQVAVRARDAGFEVIYQGIRLTPEQIVAAAVAEDVHCVGLSILSGSHMELVPAVLDGLAEAGLGDVPVIVGGIIPDSDGRALVERGVAAVYTPKDFGLTEIMAGIVRSSGSAERPRLSLGRVRAWTCSRWPSGPTWPCSPSGAAWSRTAGTHLAVRTPDNPAFHWGNFYLLARPPRADEVDALVATYDAEFATSKHRAFGVDGTEDHGDALDPLVAAGPERGRRDRDDRDVGARAAAAEHRRGVPPAAHRRRLGRAGRDLVGGQRGRVPPRGLPAVRHRQGGHRAGPGRGRPRRLVGCVRRRPAGRDDGPAPGGDGLARFQSVETHPDFRGRGLAGTLVHRVSGYGFDELGARTLVMVADPDYLAVRIYRSVGFADTEVQTQLRQTRR